MTSLSEAEKLLEAEGNLHSAKDPASAETEPRAGTAENEVEPETNVQTGVAGSGTDVTLPSDEEWAAWMQQLQTDQAAKEKKEKEATDCLTCRIAELEQQRMEQDARYGQLQQKLHISESVAPSKTLCQSQGIPSVSTRAPAAGISVSVV